MSAWETPGASDEWYTPKYIFDALGCRFDMDVAAPMRGPLHVPCDTWIYDYSLSKPWHGFLWMNPPFGGRNALEPWLNKFLDHANGIALTPDRTSAPWFRKAWARIDLALFMPKVRFIRPDGTEGKSPSTGTTLWASGPIACAALRRACAAGLGILAAPEFPAVPSDGRKVVALHNAGDGHTPTPAVALSATTLPEGARAPNREALSGSLFNRAHAEPDTSQVQRNHAF